jgi:hypothetical protein
MKFKYQESKKEELFSAVRSNNLKKVKDLLSNGDIDISSIDPDVEGTQGHLLIASAVHASTEMVKLLIESGVTKSINTVLVDGNLNGKTILGYAVRDNNKDLAKLLVKTGAKLNNGEFLGSFCIQNHPIRYGSCELLIELLKLTSKEDMLDTLRTAAMFKRYDIVKAIISSGLYEFKDIVQYYKGTETLIHLTRILNFSVFDILPNITPTEIRGDIGSALLKYAIIDKNMDLIKQLIKTGAKFGNQFGDIISDLTKHGNYELLIKLLKLTSKEDVLGGLKTAVNHHRNDVVKAVVSSGLCEFKDIIEYYNKDAITLIHLTRILNFSVFDILPNITPTEMQGDIGRRLLGDAVIDKNKNLAESLIKAGAKFGNTRYTTSDPFKDENCELLIELLKLTSKEDMLDAFKAAPNDVVKAIVSSGLCKFEDIIEYYNKDAITLIHLTRKLDFSVFDILPYITPKEMQGHVGRILLGDAVMDKNKNLAESLIKAGAKFDNKFGYIIKDPLEHGNCELLIELLKLTSKEDMLGALKAAVNYKRNDVVKAVVSSGLCKFKDIIEYYNKDTVALASLTKILDSSVFDEIIPNITHKFDDLKELEKSLIGKESNNELDEI